jgi:predicted  nucleic acid-binding Zn-ribbon protein
MIKKQFYFYSWLLLVVFFLGFSWELQAQEEEHLHLPNSGGTLNRLLEISAQLSTLNERLREELSDSRQSSRELQIMLEASRKELEELKTELELLRHNSTGLLSKAENSQAELTALLTALRRAESSLMSLELSFTAYRETAEQRIRGLDREKRLWKWGCIAAGVLAAGFGGAFLLGR